MRYLCVPSESIDLRFIPCKYPRFILNLTQSCIKSVKTQKSSELPNSSSIWILTNNDNPHKNEDDAKRIMATMENGIDIHLLPLPPNDKVFDASLFYEKFVSQSHVFTEDTPIGADSLLRLFNQANREIRKFAVLPLLLPGWKERKNDKGVIMLDLYSKIRIESLPQNETKEELNRCDYFLNYSCYSFISQSQNYFFVVHKCLKSRPKRLS